MKDKKILIVTSLVLLLLLTTGFSYAYFSASVKGNDNAKDMVVEAGTLKLTYTDGPAINARNIKPGWTTTKTVSVKNNGTLDAYYNVIWQSLVNEITNDELVISATCQRLNTSGTVEGTCESISQTPIKDTTISSNILIENGVTHKYTFTILFKEKNANQNYNQGKKFSGVLGIEEYKDTAVYCTYDGELTQGAEYVNGQYTYRYKQEGTYSSSSIAWENISSDGWGVQLTDKTSTDAVNSEVCTYINNKPVVSMSSMFGDSKATTLDVSNFNTSNVTNMNRMFSRSQATTLDLRGLDTKNVTNMSYMFSGSQVTTLDLDNIFTGNVTDMSYMFSRSQATTLDLSSFDTSNVTYMSSMFDNSKVVTLDLSSFDTSNVINMKAMFNGASYLKTIYASNKFVLASSSSNDPMFFNGCSSLVGGAGTKYDSDYTESKYAHIDGGTSNPGYFTDIADKK